MENQLEVKSQRIVQFAVMIQVLEVDDEQPVISFVHNQGNVSTVVHTYEDVSLVLNNMVAKVRSAVLSQQDTRNRN